MKQKKNIILFIITMILSLIILGFFVTGFYSVDTLWIYTRGYTDYATQDAYIRDGRLFSALIFVIIGLFNPKIITVYIINIIIAIIILSICVIQIYHLIERYKKLEKPKHKFIAFMLSYTYIFNFLIVDVLKYIDSFIIASSILLFIIAIKKIIIEKKNKIGFLLTILGVICYQGTIPVFIALAILITLLENKIINKEYFKKILPCAISIISAAVLSVIIVNFVPIITDMEISGRIGETDHIDMIGKNLLNMNQIVFQTFYMFPPYTWIGIALFIIFITIIYGIREMKLQLSINILVVFMLYISSLLLMFPLVNLTMAQRVALVLGQTISAICIYIYCTNFKNEKMNIYEKVMVGIISLYFILTIVSIFKSTYEYKLANKIDEEFSQKIENEIMKLEEQGIKINKIGINYTEKGINIQKYSELVKEQSRYMRGLYGLGLHEFYTGRKLSSVLLLTEEQRESYFENSGEEIQFKNVGDILYILIDL